MKKGLLGLFTILLAGFGFGGVSMAEEFLYVGSHQVTSSETNANCDGGGTYSYNQDAKILTFDNCIVISYANGGSQWEPTAIRARNINLTIQGKLTINVPTGNVYGIGLDGNQTGSLTLDGDIISNSPNGIAAWNHDITIKSGTLITSGYIFAYPGNLIIKSDVKRVETTHYIRATNGTISIEDPLAIIVGGTIQTGGTDQTIGSYGYPVVIAPVTKITNINISGITNPVLLETPTTSGLVVTSTPANAINLDTELVPYWRAKKAGADVRGGISSEHGYDYNRLRPPFNNNTEFYFLRIIFTPADGYTLAENYTVTADSGYDSILTGVNDYLLDGYISYKSADGLNYIHIRYLTENIPARTTISAISITGVVAPVGGATPDLDLDNITKLLPEQGITLSAIKWYNSDGVDRGNALTNSSEFISGNQYELAVEFTPDYGYQVNTYYDSNPTALTINGENGEVDYNNSKYELTKIYTATAPVSAPTTYTITWKNGDTILKTGAVAEGATPVYDGDTPTKAEDSSCTYTFDKWTPDLAPATGNTTYTATFTCTAKQSSSSPSTSSGGKTVKKDKIDVQTDKDTEKEDTKNNDKEDNNEKDNSDTPMYEQGDQSEVLDNGYTREFNNAYRFGLKYGITTMDDINKADMHGPLTRIAMDKMLVNYAINVLHMVPDTTREVPNFPDIDEKLNEEYGNAVTLGYQLGIMGINITEFRPFDEVPRADFGTSLGRMLFGLEDGEGLYYEPHLKKLKEKGIITNDDPNLQELRGYVMIMLMRSAI